MEGSFFAIKTRDEKEHRVFLSGPRLHIAISDFYNHCRSKWKYGTEEENKTTWEDAWTKFHDLLKENDVDRDVEF